MIYRRDEIGVRGRTRALPASRAFSFAKCLEQNAGFDEVWVKPETGTDQMIVEYRRLHPKKTEELRALNQDVRTVRALLERDGYTFEQREFNDRRFWACRSPKGAVYFLTGGEERPARCSCPDYVNRCEGTERRCKHLRMLDLETEDQVEWRTDRKHQKGRKRPAAKKDRGSDT